MADTYFLSRLSSGKASSISLLVGNAASVYHPTYASAVMQMFQTFPQVTQCTFKTGKGEPARVAVAGDMSQVDGAIKTAANFFKHHPKKGDAKALEQYTDLRCEIPAV